MANAHGDAAAVDEEAREISDNCEDSYDDCDQHEAGRNSERQVPSASRSRRCAIHSRFTFSIITVN